VDFPVERDKVFACLLWSGRRDRDGYGRLPDGRLAHRVAYEQAYGPLGKGLEAEHGCKRRHCCEPRHLEAFTRAEQERSKRFTWAVRKRRCRFNHDMTHAAITPELGRVCRTCTKELLA